MSEDSRAEAARARLLERAERCFLRKKPAAIFAAKRALIGGNVEEMSQLAQEAMARLRCPGQRPSPAQLAALETAIRLMRPAPCSRSGALDPLQADSAAAFPGWEAFRERARDLLYAIGRIESVAERPGAVGTGFLVAQDLLCTNRHVLRQLACGGLELGPGQGRVHFQYELGVLPTEDPVAITGVAAVHATLDLALLRIARVPESPGRRPLVFAPAAVQAGAQVVAVGYPFRDDRRNPLFANALFEDSYGLKHAAPGEVVEVGPDAVFHDCSTLGGNSGSPLLSLDAECAVVGVHREGSYLYTNEAVPGPLARDFVQAHLPPGGS